MKRVSYIALVAAFAVAFNAYAGEGHAKHWSYEGQEGPEHWGELSGDFAACKSGVKQSPVDLKEQVKAELMPLEFNYKTIPLKVLNNGHTFQVDEKGGGTLKFQGQEYQLVQFHFHTPSEHKMEGQAHEMEVHFVHKNDQGQLAVVGVMINPGKENAALKAAWDSMPKDAKDVEVSGAAINAGDIMPNGRNYQHYIGSLTTPPCSEGVRWIVLNEPIEMSQEQIDTFKAVFHHNARPVQPMHDRFLLNSGK